MVGHPLLLDQAEQLLRGGNEAAARIAAKTRAARLGSGVADEPPPEDKWLLAPDEEMPPALGLDDTGPTRSTRGSALKKSIVSPGSDCGRWLEQLIGHSGRTGTVWYFKVN